MYITNVFYLSLLFRDEKKEVEMKRRQAYPFSLRMICSIVPEGKGEKENKKEDGKDWTCKSPPPSIYPSQLNLNS